MGPRRVVLVVVGEDAARREAEAAVEGGDVYLAMGVATAEEALAALDHMVPDAVVVDLALRHTSGMALARMVRTRPRTRDLPMVVVTDLPKGHAVRQRAETLARAPVIEKPWDAGVLQAVLRTAIDEARRLDGARVGE